MAGAAGKTVFHQEAEAEAASELKKEFRSAVEALVEEDDDDCGLGATDTAIRALCALKDLKLKQSDAECVRLGNLGFQPPPEEFRCPISGVLMKEPVVLASGETFEEQCIKKWLEDGHRECPPTNHDLPHTVYTPNHLIKNMIMNWCKEHQIDMPRTSLTTDEESASNADREHLIELLERVSSSTLSGQKEAVKELRLLTNRLPSCRAFFGEITGALSRLLSPLLLQKAYSDPDLHKDLVATVFNISTHESNRSKIVTAIPFLIASLRSESVDTVSHAAAALYELSTIDSNKLVLGESRVIKALIEFIQDGYYLALKDAALALLNVCTVIENGETAVSEGALVAVMHKIKCRVLIDEMLELLAMFSRHRQGIEEMDEHGILFCLFDILREDTTSEQNKEICVAVIHAMCWSDRKIMRKVDRVENVYEMLTQIARTGTSRAKRKASSLIEKLQKPKFSPHTA